jgi:hypothetical protein
MSYPIIFYLVMIKIVKIFIIGLLGFSDKGFHWKMNLVF